MQYALTEIELVPQTTVDSSYPLSQEVKDEIKTASSKFKPNGYDYSKPAIFKTREGHQTDDVGGAANIATILLPARCLFHSRKSPTGRKMKKTA